MLKAQMAKCKKANYTNTTDLYITDADKDNSYNNNNNYNDVKINYVNDSNGNSKDKSMDNNSSVCNDNKCGKIN